MGKRERKRRKKEEKKEKEEKETSPPLFLHPSINNFCLLQASKMAQYPAAMHPSEEDMKMMLACQVHVGSTNLDSNMERYVWDRRRSDGLVFPLFLLLLCFLFFLSFFFPSTVCLLVVC